MRNFLIRFFLLLFMLFSAFVSKAQIIYNIDDFSDQYYAEIEFPSKGSLFVRGNATIKVIDKTTNQILFKENAMQGIKGIDHPKEKEDSINLPYQDQKLIRYSDFNLDGIKDFVIAAWEPMGKEYSYKVYTGDKKGGFNFNKTLSEITDDRRGLFQFDQNTKEYLTDNPNNYHQIYKYAYKIIKDTLVLMRAHTKTSVEFGLLFIDEIRYQRNQPEDSLKKETLQYLNTERLWLKELLSFEIPNKKRTVKLISDRNQLYYLLIRPDQSIEHIYQEAFAVSPDTTSALKISFEEELYTLYETENEIGIKIDYNGKKYDWKGDKAGQHGSLKEVLENADKNLYKIRRISLPESPYYAAFFIEDQPKKDTDYLTGEGWIKVFDKKTDKELIKVESDYFFVTLHDDEAVANIQELPYGEQSVLIYKDFNFDGKKDLAINDGNHSCYGGPSYQIYLADKDGFYFDEAFTELAQNNCGMFMVNQAEQTLETMTKSGCCWHQYSTYTIKDNQPYLLKRTEDDHRSATGAIITINKTQRENGKLKEKSIQKFNSDLLIDEKGEFNNQLISYFEFENKKKMYLFWNIANEITYVFTNADDEVELLYDGPFKRNTEDIPCKEDYFSFTKGETTYTVFYDRLEVKIKDEKHRLIPVVKNRGIHEVYDTTIMYEDCLEH